MPIRFIDEEMTTEQPKSKIRFLDEEPTQEQPKSEQESFLQRAGDLAMQNIRGVVDPAVSSVKSLGEGLREAGRVGNERLAEADNPIEKGLAYAGAGARAVGATVAAPFNALLGIGNNAIPQIIKNYVSNDAGVQAIGKGVGYVAEKLKKAPDWLKDVGDVALVLPVAAFGSKMAKEGGETAFNAASDVAAGASRTTGKALQTIDRRVGKIAQETSGVSEEALRMAGTKGGREALSGAANKQYEIGKKLVDMVDNADEFIPEREIVSTALEKMPPMNLNTILKEIDNAKVMEGSPSAIAANKRLDGLKEIYSELSTGEPFSANKYRELRKQLDYEIQSAFNKDPGVASIFEKQAMKIRTAMKKELEAAAEASGNPEYIDAMKSWHSKLDKLDELKSFLGKNSTTRGNRAESFVANLFNKNKTQQQNTLKDISDVFGNDFNAEAKLTYLANELGPEGKASFLPRWTTGRSLWAKGLGMATGSPAIASRVTLPISGKIGDAGRKLEGLGSKKINASNFDDVDWDRLKSAPDDIRNPLPESRGLPAPMVPSGSGYIKKPMIPSVGDRVRAVGKTDDYKYANIKDNPVSIDPNQKFLLSPEGIQKQYPHLSKEDARKMAFKFNERKALPAPMVGEGARLTPSGSGYVGDPMLPNMGEKLKSIGTGEQNRFKMPETSSIPKREPLAIDIGQAAKEFTTLPQLKAATKKILQEVPLTTDDKERLVDFMRYINGLNENTSDWPLRIEKYKRRTSKRYNIDPDLGNRRLGR